MSGVMARPFTLYVVFLTLQVMPVFMAPKDDTKEDFVSKYPVGDARWCIDRARSTKFDLSRLEVLPGSGWDNLLNVEFGMAAGFQFRLCKVTDDGQRLVPDDVFTVPLKRSASDSHARIFKSVEKVKSMTSHSVNDDGSGENGEKLTASGSYSEENKHLKESMISGESITVRVQLRFAKYEVKLQPDFNLSPTLKTRLLRIAGYIKLGHLEHARYHSQLVVRDFGTHVLTSITAGASLTKDTYLKRNQTSLSEEEITRTAVRLSFEYTNSNSEDTPANCSSETSEEELEQNNSVDNQTIEEELEQNNSTDNKTTEEVLEITTDNTTTEETTTEKTTTEETTTEETTTEETTTEKPKITITGALTAEQLEIKTENKFFMSLTTGAKIWTHGGPTFGAEASIDEWMDSLNSNLVAIDRSGQRLNVLITQKVFPKLPFKTVAKMEELLRESIDKYYEVNTHPGCTDPDSENFNPRANFNDGSCKRKKKTGRLVMKTAINKYIPFGGVYRKCKVSGKYKGKSPCHDFEQTHPITRKFSCPDGYFSIKLTNGVVKVFTEKVEKCESSYFFGGCKSYKYVDINATITYTTYWCVASAKRKKEFEGYLFGGVYTNEVMNIVTQLKECPDDFLAIRMINDLHICLRDNVSPVPASAIPLGGFFSCQIGNPLVNIKSKGTLSQYAANKIDSYKKNCPRGYKKHLATSVDGCDIHYCILLDNLKEPSRLKRPPFMDPPTPLNITEDELLQYENILKSETPCIDVNGFVVATLACSAIILSVN